MQIFLDLKWDKHSLKDKIIWDISNPDNNPEEFAHTMVADLNLPRVFASLIAMQIRRQISNYAIKCA